LMVWGLLVLVLIERVTIQENFGRMWAPWWVVAMMGFCIWGWAITVPASVMWEVQFVQFKVFVLVLPLFLLASAMLQTKGMWNRVIVSVLLAGVWVAGLGALEFFVPATGNYFKGLMVETAPYIGEEGFLRAPFSFWGSPDAVYVSMVATPLIPAVWAMTSKKLPRVLLLIAGVVLLTGVYISGHRSAWILLLLLSGLWVFLRKGAVWGILVVVAGFLALGEHPASGGSGEVPIRDSGGGGEVRRFEWKEKVGAC
jgi:hypothetical protein